MEQNLEVDMVFEFIHPRLRETSDIESDLTEDSVALSDSSVDDTLSGDSHRPDAIVPNPECISSKPQLTPVMRLLQGTFRRIFVTSLAASLALLLW